MSISDAMLDWVRKRVCGGDRPGILFVSGAQGIGKSTALRGVAAQSEGRILAMSLDDFYLTRAERTRLAQVVHPLFETRGPPGTHDLSLLMETLTALTTSPFNPGIQVPVFDKRTDDRAPQEDWPVIMHRPDYIIVEGWLMGVLSDDSAVYSAPINAVEKRDTDGTWRAYQEDQLAGPYKALWALADSFLHLDAPDFETVLSWRLEQEKSNLGETGVELSQERIDRVSQFILHFERLTRRMLAGKRCAGTSFKIGYDRRVLARSKDRNP